MRKDAEHNRLKLIEAAGALMRERGADVAMGTIAAKAGLTRGTLYRNFADRYAMYAAVLENNLEDLRKQLADAPDHSLLFLRLLAEMMISYDRFLVELAHMTDFDVESQHRRIHVAIEQPLREAQAKGLLREDLSPRDIVTASRMLASHWRLDGETDPRIALENRLSLMLSGLSKT